MFEHTIVLNNEELELLLHCKVLKIIQPDGVFVLKYDEDKKTEVY